MKKCEKCGQVILYGRSHKPCEVEMREIQVIKPHYYFSPFKLGDRVFIISEDWREEFIKCTMCEGNSNLKIEGKDIEILCPQCFGNGGKTNYLPMKWEISSHRSREGKYTIGRVGLEHTSQDGIEWEYMCEETGIGTGTLHKMKDIFLTKQEALAECEKRNAENERN